MASGELLASSKFYVQFDGLDDLTVKKVSGIQITLETLGIRNLWELAKVAKVKCKQQLLGLVMVKLR